MFVCFVTLKKHNNASKCKNCDDSIAHAIYAFAKRARACLPYFSFYEILLFFLFSFALISANERKIPFRGKENAKQKNIQQQTAAKRYRAVSRSK